MKIFYTNWENENMKSYIDLHTHSLASGHAYSTISEMARFASEKHMTLLGISEHAPAMPGSCNEIYFANMKILPRCMFGVEMMYGVEANIMDYEGKLDLREGILKRLDYVIASMHIPCVKPGTMEENTSAMIGAIKNPYVVILGHPDDSRYPIDVEKVVSAAKDNNKIIELNNSSLTPTASRKNARENDVQVLRLCKQYKVPILMGSDAHYHEIVGDFTLAEEMLEQCDFPQELVLNYSLEKLYRYLPKKNGTLL